MLLAWCNSSYFECLVGLIRFRRCRQPRFKCNALFEALNQRVASTRRLVPCLVEPGALASQSSKARPPRHVSIYLLAVPQHVDQGQGALMKTQCGRPSASALPVAVLPLIVVGYDSSREIASRGGLVAEGVYSSKALFIGPASLPITSRTLRPLPSRMVKSPSSKIGRCSILPPLKNPPLKHSAKTG